MAELNKAALYAALDKFKKDKDKDGLWYWIKTVFGVEIPRKKVCPNHDAPFDFVSAVFFEEYQNIIAVANRTGGKTLDFSILDVLNSYLHPNCETATVGAIEDQAKRCYGYVQNHIENVDIFKDKVKDSLMSRTDWTNGSVIQILTGTIRGVNAPHPQKVFLDEVELMVWMVLQEAFSMPQSKYGIKGQMIITSSRKFAFGPMERLLSEAKKRNFKVFKWCVRETIQPHNESEVKNTILYEDFKDYYVNGKFPSDGYLSVEDVISKKRQLDEDTWKSQWLCERPMQTNLVYPQFNEFHHVKSIKPDMGSELYLSEDPGFAEGHANVVGFWQIEPPVKAKLIASIWVEGKNDDQIIRMVEDKIIELGFIEPKYAKLVDNTDVPNTNSDLRRLLTNKVTAWYFPHNAPSAMQLRARYGYTMISQSVAELTKVVNGIPLVRKALKDGNLIFDPSNVGVINEMRMYHNRKRSDGTILDEPAKEVDNGPDMVRYFYINHFPAQHADKFVDKNIDRESEMYTSGIRNKVF